jgi:hypothetical protein
MTYSGQSVLGLVLLGSLKVVVNQAETSGLSTTEGSAETEKVDQVDLLDLVKLLENVGGSRKLIK